jgi:hypothetical protein
VLLTYRRLTSPLAFVANGAHLHSHPPHLGRTLGHLPRYLILLLSEVIDVVVVKTVGTKYKYPPGPRGLPLLGVAHLLPPVHFGTVTSKWAEQYGEMMTLQLGGVRWVYLNSSRVVTELLERRSAV